MKRLLITFSIFLITICAFPQTVKLKQALSDYYKVYTDVSDEYAVEISEKMEAALVLYNEIFHFNLSSLETKFKVTIFKDKTGFNNYLQRLMGQTREDFVYIHYSDLRKSELVGFMKNNEKELTASLLHQGLIQFVKAFIPNVPLWISEGVAAYIENSTYMSGTKTEGMEEETDEDEFEETTDTDSKGHFVLNKSLVWLDSLKSIIRGEAGGSLLSLEDLLTINKEEAVPLIDIFYPEAWGFVFFLLNTQEKEYNRLFWDSINILDPAASLKDNSELVKNLITRWKNSNTLFADFKTYILSLKTFNDYVKIGLDFYNSGNYEKAEENFRTAADLKPSHYFPHYYMGLIYYAKKEYYTAEEYYLKALANGAEKALTYYALGVNAYADNNYDTAIIYLNTALEENPEKYKDKISFLLERIESEKMDEDLYMDYELDTESDLETEYDALEDEDKNSKDDVVDEDEYDEYDEYNEDEFDEDFGGK